MDQQIPNPPSMELPAPQVEGGPAAPDSLPPATDVPEARLAQQTEQPGAALPPNPLAQTSPPAGPATAAPVDPVLTVPPAVGAATPLMADDSDLIEKEWVMKAKHIVEKTKHDPHEQNKAVNRVKADYLKKRYQKDIKLNEE